MSSVEILASHSRFISAIAGLTAVLFAGLAIWVRMLLRRGRRHIHGAQGAPASSDDRAGATKCDDERGSRMSDVPPKS
jgi:hypothetical protein